MPYNKTESSSYSLESKLKWWRLLIPASLAVVVLALIADADNGADDFFELFLEPKENNRTAWEIKQLLQDLELTDDSYRYFLSQRKYPQANYVRQSISAYSEIFSFFSRNSDKVEHLDYIKFMDQVGKLDENGNPTPEARTAGAIWVYNEFKNDGYNNVPPPEYMLALCGIESNWRHFSTPGVLVEGVNGGGSSDWGFCQINDYYHADKMELAKSASWLDNLYAAYLVVIDHNAWRPDLYSDEESLLRHLAIKYHRPASNDLHHRYAQLAWERFQTQDEWWTPQYLALLDKIDSAEAITSRGFWHPPVVEHGAVTFGYGKKTTYTVDGQYWHNAVDFNYPGCEGDPVFALHNGVVKKESINGLGSNVAVLYWEQNGYEFRATYGHLQAVTLEGSVLAGQAIGKIGRDGYGVLADGTAGNGLVPHLHLRVQVKDDNGSWVAFNPCAYFDERIYESNNWLAGCTANNDHASAYDNPDYFGIGKEVIIEEGSQTIFYSGTGSYVITNDSSEDSESGGGMRSPSGEYLNGLEPIFKKTFTSAAYDGIGGNYAYNETLPMVNYEQRTGRNYIIIEAGETWSFNDTFAISLDGQPDQFIRGYLKASGVDGGGVCDTAHKFCTAALEGGLNTRQTNIDGYEVGPHQIGPGVNPACDVTIWIDYASQGGTNRRDLEISNPFSVPVIIFWDDVNQTTGTYTLTVYKMLDNGQVENDLDLAMFGPVFYFDDYKQLIESAWLGAS